MTTIPVVKIAFDLTLAGAGAFFTINSTPMGGTAISGALPIAGDVLTDVTDRVRSISVRRGRSRETDRFDAGVATVVVDNRDRLFDPTAGTAVSPFAPSLKPRKALTIEANGQAVFTGQVEDIDLEFRPDGDNVTVFKAADGFTLLNQVTLPSGTATAELSGARVNDILDQSGWPTARRQVDAGQATLGADVIGDNVNALEYLNTIAASDPGSVFIGRNGAFTFRDRLSNQTPGSIAFSDNPVTGITIPGTGFVLSVEKLDEDTLGEAALGLPFSDLAVEFGTERLHSQIEIVYTGGTAVALNTAAEIAYGLDVLRVNTLLSNSNQAQNLADFYAERFGEPIARINALTIPVDTLSGVALGNVLGLDLGDVVFIQFTPNGIGAPLFQTVVIESIEHQITPGSHRMRLTLSQSLGGFVLDVSSLDEDLLGF
jgi:hypothetical protein